jgi:hypothetical protein
MKLSGHDTIVLLVIGCFVIGYAAVLILAAQSLYN